jgi:ribosome biogenesis GTPase A
MSKTIQWYPGHMAKAKRIVAEDLKVVDVVIEVLDARLPRSSANPVLNELVGTRPAVIAMNKADLGDPAVNEAWVKHFEASGRPASLLNAVEGKGIRQLLQKARQAGAPALNKLTKKGLRPRPVRVMIIGIPNVGKSSLVNRVVRTASAKTGDKPGVTRGRQWIRVEGEVDLLDTPGILPPSLPDQKSALLLGICGALKDNIYDVCEAALELIHQLETRYPDRFRDRYLKGRPPVASTVEGLLEEAARAQGLLGREGVVQVENMARMMLADFRQGRLGPISFETPEERLK